MNDLAFAVICGDAGTATLPRLVESLLHRDGGPICDWLVLQWNGIDDVKFANALRVAFPGAEPPLPLSTEYDADVVFQFEGISVQIHRFTWIEDFGTARQVSFERAGRLARWVGYLDTDDVIPGAEDEAGAAAQDASIKRFGGKDTESVPVETLKDYLKRLPPAVNCLVAPYHYTIGGSGEVLKVIPRRRIIRWGDGFFWHKKIHEDVVPLPGNQIRWVGNGGFVIEHYPSEDRLAKLRRNAKIVRDIAEELKSRANPMDHRTLYNMGAILLEEGDFVRAAEFLLRASAEADQARSLGDSLQYRALLVRANLLAGRPESALSVACDQIALAPASAEGFLSMLDITYQAGDWARLVAWYEHLQRLPTSSLTDIVGGVEAPVERHAWPAAWASIGYGNLGRPTDALRCAELAVKHGPSDVFCIEALRLAQIAKRDADLAAAMKLLVDFNLSAGNLYGAEQVLEAAPRVEEDLVVEQRRAVKAALDATVDVPSADEIAWDPREDKQLERVFAIGPQDPTAVDNLSSEDVLTLATYRGFVSTLEETEPGKVTAVVDPDRDTYVDVTIFAPAYNEAWAPEWVETQGIGGSEEAIVYLSETLAERGFRVTVYGPAEQRLKVRVRNGVIWRRLRDFDLTEHRSILIAHRAPWIVQNSPNCDRLIIWHHDHMYDSREWNLTWAKKAEHLFVSAWQRDLLFRQIAVQLPISEQAAFFTVGHEGVLRGAVIGNGIPAAQCAMEIDLETNEREKHRVVYASQPIRGLTRLLDVWPEVLTKFPDAKLHLYYGKKTNKLGAFQSPEIAAELDRVDAMMRGEHLVADLKDIAPSEVHETEEKRRFVASIVDHDRIPQPQLMDEMRKASVWAYPCAYPEVSCIAGLRAAAAGLFPVFASWGTALAETQPNQVYGVAAEWDSEGGRKMFIDNLLKALAGGAAIAGGRNVLRADAVAFHGWEIVANRLETMLNTAVIAETTTRQTSAERV